MTYLTELNNAGIRAAATKADKAGNGNGKIDTRKEFELIFDYYEKTKPSYPRAYENMEDPTITADMDMLKAGYAILKYNEETEEQEKLLDEALKEAVEKPIKIPRTAAEAEVILNEIVKETEATNKSKDLCEMSKKESDTTIGTIIGGVVGAAAGGIAADKLCYKINNKAFFNAIPRDYKKAVINGKSPLKVGRTMIFKQPMRGGRWSAAVAFGALALGAVGAWLGGKVQENV